MTEPRSGRVEAAARRVGAVLFDLDDTLFDHRHCSRTALETVQQAHACLHGVPFEELQRRHSRLLEEIHRDVMLGVVGVDVAREERFRRLFLTADIKATEDVAASAAATYRRNYLAARRSIAGAAPLLERVRSRAAVVIVSNNVLEEQRGKLGHCGLDHLIDVLVVSEEEGISKPDPEIFRRALARVGCRAEEAVMLGDSWAADIVGARAAGIRPIWVNLAGLPRPEDADDVEEIRALEPIDDVMSVIFGGDAGAYADRR